MKHLLDEIKFVYSLSDQNKMTDEELKTDMSSKRVALLFLSLSAIALSIVNIIRQYWFMTFTTLLLSVILFVCSLLSKNIKYRKLVTIICAISISAIFSYYSISGQNNGFAILWTLLVPPVSSLLIGLRASFLVSLYFELMFLIMFWTPIKVNFVGIYTQTFIERYPLLYLVSFVISVYLVIRKDLYKYKAQNMAYLDVLTGINNRRYFEEYLRKLEKLGKLQEATIFMTDVNRLKYTNDNFGHSAGDGLLISVADYFKSIFTEEDCVCRLGGDEFGVISLESDEKCEDYKNRLDHYVFKWEGKIIPEPSLSTGVIKVREYPDCTIEEIERYADGSMYKAKEMYYRNSGVDRRVG